jgi:hypothetical protein
LDGFNLGTKKIKQLLSEISILRWGIEGALDTENANLREIAANLEVAKMIMEKVRNVLKYKKEREEDMGEDKELLELKSVLEENVSPERELLNRINRLIIKPCLEQIKSAAWEIYIEDISEKRAKAMLEYAIKELSKEIESTYSSKNGNSD